MSFSDIIERARKKAQQADQKLGLGRYEKQPETTTPASNTQSQSVSFHALPLPGAAKTLTLPALGGKMDYTALLTAPRNRGTVSGLNVTENVIPATAPKSNRTQAAQTAQTYPTPEDEGVSKRFTTFMNSAVKGVESAPMVIADALKQHMQDSTANQQSPAQESLRKKLDVLSNQIDYLERYVYPTRADAQASDEWKKLDAERNQVYDELKQSQIDTPISMNAPGMQKMAEARQAGQDYLNTFPQGSAEQKVAGGVLSLGQNAAYLPLGVLGPAAPAVAMGAQAAANKVYDSTAQGDGANRALTRGAVSGAISAATNYLPVKNVLSLVKTGGTSVVKNLLEQAGVQAGQETADYALNYLADKAAKDPNATFSVKELADSALSGAGTGLVFGGAGTVIGGAVRGMKAAALPISDQAARYQAMPIKQAEKSKIAEAPSFDTVKLDADSPVRLDGTDSSTIRISDTPTLNEAKSRALDPPVQTSESVSKINAPPIPDISAEGDGLGAMNNPHAQGVSKVVTNTLQKSKIFSEAEKQMKMLSAEDNTYDIITEKQSMAEAQSRLTNDFAGEEVDLPEKNDWTSADLDTAMGILSQKTQDARQSGDYSQVDKWAKSIKEHGTRAGQMTQAFAKYSRTPEGTIVDAEHQLSGTKLNDTQKNKVMGDVQSQLDAMESAGDDSESLIQVIKDTSAIRRTGSFFNNKPSAALEKAMNALTPDALKDIALSQIQSIPTDYQTRTLGQKARSVRSMMLLSNLATVHRNIAGNLSFDLIDAVSTVPSTALDIALSKATGTRSTTVDPSWISKEKWDASVHAGLRAYVESALDVDTENMESRYGLSSKRTFKMTGNPIDRFFSAWEKYTSYALNVPDEFQKGGIEATVQSGVDRLNGRGLVKDDTLDTRGKEVAKYRTFRDNTKLSSAMMGLHDIGNLVGIGTSNGKTFHGLPVKDMGVGDLVLPFARVPANLVSRALEYSPAGLAKGAVEISGALKGAKAGTLTAAQQAQAVSDVGRGLTGSGLIAIFAAAAAANLLRVAPDTEDKDVSALNSSEGVSGTQLNADALSRWASGGSTEWKSGDTLVSMGFLEPLNAMMATGALVAQAAQEDGKITAKNFTESSLSGTVQSLFELPAMSSITDIMNGFQYSKASTTGGKAFDAAAQFAAGQVSSSTIPNSVRAVARGLDPYYRNQYSSDTTAGQTLDSIKAAIPGLRETLPVTQTPFGKPKEYGNSGLLNLANATIFPGSVTTYRPSAVSNEVRNLSDQTGSTSLYPDRNAAPSISYDSQKYELTPTEQNQYHEIYGKAAYDSMQGLMGFKGYDNLSTEEKADAMAKALTYASDVAKKQILDSRGVNYESSLLKGAGAKSGDPLYEYLAYKAIYSSLGDDLSKQGKIDAITDSKYGFSDSTLYSALSDSQKKAYNADVKGKAGLDVYMDVAAYAGSADGEKDDDGKTISGSKKSKVMAYINKQKITSSAKDALYLAMGYSKSTLYEDAPWH